MPQTHVSKGELGARRHITHHPEDFSRGFLVTITIIFIIFVILATHGGEKAFGIWIIGSWRDNRETLHFAIGSIDASKPVSALENRKYIWAWIREVLKKWRSDNGK